MQCYAVMKIILKEFVKKKCSPQNQVLCSYFIKTFLFWKYETTSFDFWKKTNFRECIKYLIIEFYLCLKEGVIRHYFIPSFNLLSVKLTPEAKIELLQLFDDIIQSDMSIMRDCITLRDVWAKFLSADKNKTSITHSACRTNFLKNDKLFMKYSTEWRIKMADIDPSSVFMNYISKEILEEITQSHARSYLKIRSYSLEDHINQIRSLPCKTFLPSVLIKQSVIEEYVMQAKTLCQGNKGLYRLHHIINHNKSSAIDISTCKLRYAIILLMKGDYDLTLTIVNQVLSSIPPFALYSSNEGTEGERLYVDIFLKSEQNIMQRARKAWLRDLIVEKRMAEIMPLAIRVELFVIDCNIKVVCLSPFICLYYMMFMCYHNLGQYDNRDRALRQLIDVANNYDQSGRMPHHSFNIAGHCLLIAGDIVRARRMFFTSYMLTHDCPPFDKFNAAPWYMYESVLLATADIFSKVTQNLFS